MHQKESGLKERNKSSTSLYTYLDSGNIALKPNLTFLSTITIGKCQIHREKSYPIDLRLVGIDNPIAVGVMDLIVL
jgi:hypothetical protein